MYKRQVPACAIDHGYSAIGIVDDTVGYFVILLGENEELDRLACTVDNPVEHDANDEPVSYTHLDVYKRQGRVCGERCKFFQNRFPTRDKRIVYVQPAGNLK